MREALKNGFRCIAILTLLALSACSTVRPNFVREASTSMPPVTDTSSARYVRAELGRHPGQSGFRLLSRGTNALTSRIALADHAQSSIDLQYYIFHNDPTGRLLAQRLLAAADRGVRVRILLDDINPGDSERVLDALDAHKNIEVRLFNPFSTRNPSTLSKIAQFALEGRRLNRRMHNKSYIVDGNVAVIGGRNIGDEYFGASEEFDLRDLDVIMIGSVVGAAARSFDDYWNCEFALPVAAYRETRNKPEDLATVRHELGIDARAFAESDYAQELIEETPNVAKADEPGRWFWGNALLVADQPEKISAGKDQPSMRIGPQLKAVIDAAQSEVLLISPYFIPDRKATDYLAGLVQRKVSIKLLTNSLASNDEPLVHAGYARHRRALLDGGVDIYELKPAAGEKQSVTARGQSSGASLHAKAFVVDRRHVFVGSLNMDPRSKLLNTEMGVIVDSPALAAAVAQFFANAARPQNSFHVMLSPDQSRSAKIRWLTAEDGKEMSYDSDPGAQTSRKIQFFFMRLLPIESLL